MEYLKVLAQSIWIIIFVIFNASLFVWVAVDWECGSFEKKHIIPIVFFALEFIVLTYFAWG